MNRDYAWRKRKRYVKAIRRLNNDIATHGDWFDCECFGAKKWGKGLTFSQFADNPKMCARMCCANPRKFFKGKHKWELSRQELNAPDIEEWE